MGGLLKFTTPAVILPRSNYGQAAPRATGTTLGGPCVATAATSGVDVIGKGPTLDLLVRPAGRGPWGQEEQRKGGNALVR